MIAVELTPPPYPELTTILRLRYIVSDSAEHRIKELSPSVGLETKSTNIPRVGNIGTEVRPCYLPKPLLKPIAPSKTPPS